MLLELYKKMVKTMTTIKDVAYSYLEDKEEDKTNMKNEALKVLNIIKESESNDKSK